MKISYIAERILSNRTKNIKLRKKDLQNDLNKAVNILTHHYRVKRIILFGSMVNGKINYRSDVDLVVEGLGDQYFKAIGHCWGECKTVIDIKPFEDINADFRKLVLEKGRVIYESGRSV